MAPPTQRLFLEAPTRKTALAAVTSHASGGFLLDRTLFHAARKDYHHLQPCDRGHVLAEGHKLKVDKVFWNERGDLVHHTSGPIPNPGEKAQLHLDAARRDQNAHAHTLMHLLVQGAAEARAEFLAAPAVVGGGEARLHVRFREDARESIGRTLQRAQQLIDARLDVTAQWATRDDAARLVTQHPVALESTAPDEPTLRLVKIGAGSILPCDAPLVTNTRELHGRVAPGLMQIRGGNEARFGARLVAS